MIQIRRGKTASWRAAKTKLAAGQPGYDKDKHKIKIGDGEKLWSELPYASGLSAEEIFNSEKNAKIRYLADPEDTTIITHGVESPTEDTVGRIYLQSYEAEPEVDYVVETGINGIWTYQKWHSGIAHCWGTAEVTAAIDNSFEQIALYNDNNAFNRLTYPFVFREVPTESATLHSPSGITMLCSKSKNKKDKSALYTIISPDRLTSATYTIALNVSGHWR
jgi:hypothetical protein